MRNIVVFQSSFKKFFKIFATILATLFAIFLILIFKPSISQDYGMEYTVHSGASIQSVENDLVARDIVSHPFLFRVLVFLHGSKHHLKAGEYLFPKGSSLMSMLRQMMTGRGLVQHSFTIIAGWDFHDVRKALDNEVLLQHDIAGLTDAEIMQKIGFSNVNPEGQFFPDTYFYTYGNSDLMLLKRAYKKMQTNLNAAWDTRVADLPFKNNYEALIAASLVEKEAHVKEERPIIAGVLINRLEKNMLLQFDPTVIYGMGDKYKGVIHKSDLEEKSPYNTYVYKGLPPTPIAMPSLESINAVMHPDHNNYYYFVARGDGTHQFTENLTEHHEAVNQAKVTRQEQPYFNSTLVKQYLKSDKKS